MYCYHCGAANADDGVYCGFCGRPLRPDQPAADTEQPAGGETGLPPPAPEAAPPVTYAAPGAAPAPYTCAVCGYIMGPFESQCPRCQTPRGMSVNPDAPVPGTYMPVPGAPPPGYGPYPYAAAGNTSGMKTVAPPEVAGGWNWGGCTLGCLWSFAMGLPWWGVGALASFLCCGAFSLPIFVVLGIKGNEWSWQNRRFESLEHFRDVQRRWAIWGITIGALLLTLYGAYIVFAFIMAFTGNTRGGFFP